MASEWIKFEKATSDKPEVWAIACSLNIDPDAVVGKLLRIWSWFDEQTENGNAPSVTKMLLDRKVGVTGFCDAVINSGWMLEIDKAISLPNFERHNGETAKKRALGKNRTEKHRNAPICNAPSVTPVTQSSLTNALPEEEKKRKERDLKDRANSPTGDSPPPVDNSDLPATEKHRAKGVTKAQMREAFPDLSDQTIDDWITARKGKGAKTLTPTAWNAVVNEIRISGLTGEQALQIAAARNWQGVKSEWLLNHISGSHGPPARGPVPPATSRNQVEIQAWLESHGDERH